MAHVHLVSQYKRYILPAASRAPAGSSGLLVPNLSQPRPPPPKIPTQTETRNQHLKPMEEPFGVSQQEVRTIARVFFQNIVY